MRTQQVDGQTFERSVEAGLDFQAYIENNDAYNFFKKLGDGLIFTGATGTNVCDIAIVVVR